MTAERLGFPISRSIVRQRVAGRLCSIRRPTETSRSQIHRTAEHAISRAKPRST